MTASLVVAGLVLLTAGCDRDPVALSFSDHLAHQGDNLTTGLISVPRRLNTHLLGHGWRLPEGEVDYAELRQSVGYIQLFAARAELRRLALQAQMDRPEAHRRYRVLLNGRGIAGLDVGEERQEMRFDLPASAVRVGSNLLALRCLDCPAGERHRGPRLRLRQLRLLPAPVHGGRIRRAAADSGERFVMPAPAHLDLVAELPPRAAFRAGVVAPRAATVTLSVRDGAGERLVKEWRLTAGRRPQRLAARLDRWSGRLVRLRLAADAEDGVELDWLEAVVTGRGGAGVTEPPRASRSAAPPRSGRLGRPDIVLVLLDAARADAFGPFGGPYPTPGLEALAADGTRFTDASSPSSWTAPSVTALMTGYYPDSIGAETWHGGTDLPTPTLAELLADAGYRTVLWHQHPFYRGQQDLKQGFEEVRSARANLVDPVPPAELLYAADRPTFSFIHLLPPHAPYEPPAPFRGAYSSWYRGELEVTARLLNQFHGRRDPRELSAEDRRYIRDRYLENVAYADSLVGRIRDLLIAERRYEKSLIVVLSDHGESFLEHGRFLHTQQLYRESIHVPLVVKWPATVRPELAVIEQPVSLVDLVPTLVDGLALETDVAFQGRSLLPAALDGRTERRPVYAVTRGVTEGWRPPAPRAAFRHGRWQAIYRPFDDRLELYDRSSDPAETEDLAPAEPLLALLLRQAVLEQMALNAGLFRSTPAPQADPLDLELEEQLRGLGYLGEE